MADEYSGRTFSMDSSGIELAMRDLGIESETDQAQFRVLMEAMGMFQERNARYRDLWKENGSEDDHPVLVHKAKRLKLAVGHPDELDDAVDLINYAVFFIRNVREHR